MLSCVLYPRFPDGREAKDSTAFKCAMLEAVASKGEAAVRENWQAIHRLSQVLRTLLATFDIDQKAQGGCEVKLFIYSAVMRFMM